MNYKRGRGGRERDISISIVPKPLCLKTIFLICHFFNGISVILFKFLKNENDFYL
jgi:hypothetical protein